ncbi:hypothetical protein M0805_004837 [Coniferiporia weirii]|nr:hypothetical protein M0805_004837 [Coniferiporia weirii]
MVPKARSSSTMKQGTLSFASSKRGAAATASGKANALKAKRSATPTVLPPVTGKPTGARTVSNDSTISLSTTSTNGVDSDDDVELLSAGSAASARRGIKRLKTERGVAKAVSARSKRRTPVDDSSSDEEPEIPRESLDALERSGRLNKVYRQAKERMGDVPAIHAEKQTKVHHILRIFDTSYEYGPCVGMTRLERWERARAFGLNPPTEIRDILMTEQADKDDTYKQSVFFGDV